MFGLHARTTQPSVRHYTPMETQKAALLPIIPVMFARDGRPFSYFSTVTTLGTPIDVTAQELRIECFFPVDDETRRAAATVATLA